MISLSTPWRAKVDKSYSVSQSKRRNEEDFHGQNFKGNYILSLVNTENFFRLVGWERVQILNPSGVTLFFALNILNEYIRIFAFFSA